jgi:hypothetical protein
MNIFVNLRRVRIPLEAWMYVRLFCVDSGHATGLVTRRRSYSDCKIQISELMNSELPQTEGPNPWR